MNSADESGTRRLGGICVIPCCNIYACEDQAVALSDILAIIALLGALIGYLINCRARKKADRANSGGRIAAAVEQMAANTAEPDVNFVRVFEDALNARVQWTIEERAEPHSYRLRNTGNVDADDVQITAVPVEHAALLTGGDLGNIDAGQAGIFGTSPRLSLSLHQVTVCWVEGDTRQPMSAELNLP